MSVQDVVNGLVEQVAAVTAHLERAFAEITAEVDSLKAAVESGGNVDFTGVDSALSQLSSIAEKLDAVVPDAVPEAPTADVDVDFSADVPDSDVPDADVSDADLGIDNSTDEDADA